MLIGLSEEAFREQSGRIFANHVSDKEFASQVYKKTLEAEFQNGNSFSKVAETISMKRCGCELGYEDTCITFFGGCHGVQVGTLCITLGVLECVL